MRGWGYTVLAVASFALAACGGGESASTPEAARAEIASICEEIQPEVTRLNKELDRTTQVPRQVDLLSEQDDLLTDLATRVSEVEAPAELDSQVARLTQTVEDQVALSGQVQQALPDGGIEELQGLLLDGVDLSERRTSASEDLEVEECAPEDPATRQEVLAAFTLEVGTETTLSAQGTDVTMSVEGVIDPLPAGALSPPEGTRYVGIRVAVKNVGNRTIEVPLAYQSTLVTSDGQRLSDVEASPGGDCETAFAVELGPEDSSEECLAYPVAEEETAEAFEFGGDGGETVEWDLTTVKPESGIEPGQDPESAQGGYLDCITESQTPQDINACNELL